MREIKFRYIFEDIKEDGRTLITQTWNLNDIEINDIVYDSEGLIARNQYTGLKDKNNVEIYEYMEIDNTYEVSFLNGSYVLTNISNGDIMLLSNYMENNNGKVEITREYTKV